jgi:endonuclease G
MKKLFLTICVALTAFSCFAQDSKKDQLAMGNPSNAGTASNNFLMIKNQYALSYNADEGKPNWVSWHLDPNWIGDIERQNDFRPDSDLPQGMYHVTATDYSGSGFDRGHNCPSHDRTTSEDDNSMTFLMTNMMPQAPRNNQVTWQSFEKYCNEKLVTSEGKELYIICGSYGEGGAGKNGFAKTIANGKIIIPAHIWKIVLVLDVGQNDLKRIDQNSRVIAINTPNVNTIDGDWHKYLTTVDEIEKETGYDFFSNISKSIQSAIESKPDNEPVTIEKGKVILLERLLSDTESTPATGKIIYINCLQAEPTTHTVCNGKSTFFILFILFIGIGLCAFFYLRQQRIEIKRKRQTEKERKIVLYDSILEMLPDAYESRIASRIANLLLIHSSKLIHEAYLNALKKSDGKIVLEHFAEFFDLVREDIYGGKS